MGFLDVKLEDKYDLTKDRIYITGTQALIRLCLEQSKRDRDNGLKTGGYITGYRGSPLGAVDFQFRAAKKHLEPLDIKFEEGLNEDLAATAIWGTQQAELRGEGTHDGVFGMWYGKGPGVDRSGDAFRHANLAGTSPNGGVLAIMGDDHTCESSTTAHQSDYAMVDAQIPILYPANIQDILAFGLYGWAMSRFASVWVGLKAVKDNIESTAVIDADLSDISPVLPDFEMPEDGLAIRLGDPPQIQETRLHRYKLDAVRAFIGANPINQIIAKGIKPSIGLIAAGKSYNDMIQALDELGLDIASAEKLGVRIMKLGAIWPLVPAEIESFANGLNKIIVIEEKRSLIEDQMRAVLYGYNSMPDIIGKKNESGGILFPAELALNPVHIASEVGPRLPKTTSAISARLQDITRRLAEDRAALPVARGFGFCAGCPHNSSTKLPKGSRGYAGIGCHWMVQKLDRDVDGYTHMGAEGANWIGEAHFSARDHVFQNIGDGTYNHSGLQAIRAAIGAGTNITFKVLYNDAVAMTGGQGNDGSLDAYQISAELLAAGAKKLVYMTEDFSRIERARLPKDVTLKHRDALLEVQRELREIKGTTVLVYDQTCAAEKRRRRKRGLMPDPDQRVYINPDICEGCGDCGVQSNCVAIQPLTTPLGRKRMIDQNACNKDFSCLDGFCPSFVTLAGATPQTQKIEIAGLDDLPEPNLPTLNQPYAILVNGIGGTGVVTLGALLGMAAHLEGNAAAMIDMAGLAQKGGSVFSHIKIAKSPMQISAIRVGSASADLLLGCDLLISSDNQSLSTLHHASSYAIVNSHEQLPGEFTSSRDFRLPHDLMEARIKRSVPDGHAQFVNATAVAKALLGDTIGANLFMLGMAYQLGLIPVSANAITQAISLNGVAVELNTQAFSLGRKWVVDPDAVSVHLPQSETFEDEFDTVLADRIKRLTNYQNAALAEQYKSISCNAAKLDAEFGQAVAKNLYKVMAYKDEYEVARLFAASAFKDGLKTNFAHWSKMTFHLAPPLISRRDPISGKVKKWRFGAWILPAFAVLAKGKVLRGSAFDPFGYSAERRAERNWRDEYIKHIEDLAAHWAEVNPQIASELASLPNEVRGFGHVKAEAIEQAELKRSELLKQLNRPSRVAAA